MKSKKLHRTKCNVSSYIQGLMAHKKKIACACREKEEMAMNNSYKCVSQCLNNYP